MEKINVIIGGKEKEIEVDNTNLVSDGFHTFKQLYDHRLVLSTIAFKYAHEKGWKVIRSKRHHDGELCFGGGWFIVEVIRPDGKQFSYHYKNEYWDLFDYAETVKKAPEWDGHTEDNIDRLLPLINFIEEV